MSNPTKPCPHCKGNNPERCLVCDGRGVWPRESCFQFLESVTIIAGDDTPDKQMDFLIGEHGVVIGIINEDTLTVHNFKVLVAGEGNEPYVLTPDMMKLRDVETLPRCPACNEPLKAAAGEMNKNVGFIVWTCDNVHCDVSSVAFEFPFHFDFTVFEKMTSADNSFFPDLPVRQVWASALEFDCNLIDEDTISPINPEEATRDPKYREALSILKEHELLQIN